MASTIISAIAIIAAVIILIYGYTFLQFMLTLSKCPDCGRIMQRVLYTNLQDEQKHVANECQFCQAKRIRKGVTPAHVRKRTLYP